MTDLTRATLVRNPDYERSGIRSYVRALHKCAHREDHMFNALLPLTVRQTTSHRHWKDPIDSPENRNNQYPKAKFRLTVTSHLAKRLPTSLNWSRKMRTVATSEKSQYAHMKLQTITVTFRS